MWSVGYSDRKDNDESNDPQMNVVHNKQFREVHKVVHELIEPAGKNHMMKYFIMLEATL